MEAVLPAQGTATRGTPTLANAFVFFSNMTGKYADDTHPF
jgi:hypothetical protein